MWKELPVIVSVALCCAACDQTGTRSGPAVGVAPTTTTLPTPRGNPAISATPIVVGQTVSGMIVVTDPECTDILGEFGRGPCQEFQIVAPADGQLVIEVAWPNPQDHVGLLVGCPGTQMGRGGTSPVKATTRVKAGSSCFIAVILLDGSEATAGVPFELTTSLAP